MKLFSKLTKLSTRGQRYGGKLDLRESFRALQYLPPFLRMVWETQPGMTLASIILRLLQAGLPVTSLYVGKLIIDEVVRILDTAEGMSTYLWYLLGAELALALLSAGLGRAISLIEALLGDRLSNHTSVQLIEQAARLDLPKFEDATFYDKLEQARRQTVNRSVLVSELMEQAEQLLSILLLGAGLVAFSPWLLLLLLVAVLPTFLSELHFNQWSYSLARNWTPERRELDYVRYLGTSDETAKEVKIFGLEKHLRDRYADLADRYYEANRHLAVRRAAWGFGLSGFGDLGYYLAYALIILRTVQGQISLGDLTFLAGSFRQVRAHLRSFLSNFSYIAQSALYLRDLFEFLNMQPAIHAPEAPRAFPQPIAKGFAFDQVGFRYPSSGKYAVQGLSFELRAGEKLALVGENGAGKTTLVKLLARLYDPTEGRILLDGRDLREYDPADLRQAVGVIFQDYVRFQFSAADNIAVGRIEARLEQARIEQAAFQSLAAPVIEGLPRGYEQRLGRRFDDGVDLSGGQWQKIALGRAYMREAQLYILDEPTAALDARAEYEVFQRFAELTAGKTAVLISHRFSTVRMADRILVLKKGQMVEIGSHESLLDRGGLYAELFQLQAQGYR